MTSNNMTDSSPNTNLLTTIRTLKVAAQSTVTTKTSNVKIKPVAAASTSHDDGPGTMVTALILTFVLLLAVVIFVFTFRYLRRKGRLNNLHCWKSMTRSRKSSISSSRRALADQDEIEATVRSKKAHGNADDLFTIEDLDDPADTHEVKEEYFYDEVFSKSQFVDETTNNAMRQLYSQPDLLPEEEGLDFESLGIKLDSYDFDSGQKGSV